MDDQIKKLQEYVKEQQTNKQVCEAHSFDHTKRVFENIKKMLSHSNVNPKLALASALLHDIIRPPYREKGGPEHAQLSAQEAQHILPKFGFEEKEIKMITKAISEHSAIKSIKRDPLSQLLFEADKLETFGEVGLQRWLCLGKGDGLSPQETLKGILKIQLKLLTFNIFQNKYAKEELQKRKKMLFEHIKKEIGKDKFEHIKNNFDANYDPYAHITK